MNDVTLNGIIFMNTYHRCLLRIAALTCCLVVLLSSSIFAEVAGLYVSDENRAVFIRLYADETFVMGDGAPEISGTYTVNDTSLAFTSVQRGSFSAELDGDIWREVVAHGSGVT